MWDKVKLQGGGLGSAELWSELVSNNDQNPTGKWAQFEFSCSGIAEEPWFENI